MTDKNKPDDTSHVDWDQMAEVRLGQVDQPTRALPDDIRNRLVSEGEQARRAGLAIETCPSYKHPDMATCWRNGWTWENWKITQREIQRKANMSKREYANMTVTEIRDKYELSLAEAQRRKNAAYLLDKTEEAQTVEQLKAAIALLITMLTGVQ